MFKSAPAGVRTRMAGLATRVQVAPVWTRIDPQAATRILDKQVPLLIAVIRHHHAEMDWVLLAGLVAENPFLPVQLPLRRLVRIDVESIDKERCMLGAIVILAVRQNVVGERPYHPGYYAAFVLDPDGHNIEAVCHAPA